MANKINILVTGSEGFIGKHLVNALKENNYNVIPYDIKISKDLDILKFKKLESILKKYQPKIVIHLAATSNIEDTNKNPQLALETNIIGTYNVLSLSKKMKVEKVLLASSAATYEPEKSLYGTSKVAMESLAMMFENAFIIRFYNVYGGGSKSVVNKFISRAQHNLPLILNGNTIRDYIHIEDIISSLLKICQSNIDTKIVELGTGKSTSLKNLIEILQQVFQKKLPIIEEPPLHEIQYSTLKIKNRKFYSYEVSLEEGIKDLILKHHI